MYIKKRVVSQNFRSSYISIIQMLEKIKPNSVLFLGNNITNLVENSALLEIIHANNDSANSTLCFSNLLLFLQFQPLSQQKLA